jgi:hypothetical protein
MARRHSHVVDSRLRFLDDDERPGRPASDPDLARCRACHDEAPRQFDGFPPVGWYTVKISGRFTEDDVSPGLYCGAECLVVGGLLTFGMRGDEVRTWLRGVAGVEA